MAPSYCRHAADGVKCCILSYEADTGIPGELVIGRSSADVDGT